MNAHRHLARSICILLLGLSLPFHAAGYDATTSTQGPAVDPLHHLFHHLESITSPGPLSKAHAELDQSDRCGDCHQGTRGLNNKLCLDCHKEIARRLADKIGLHGAYTGECYECHKEHRGRNEHLIQSDEKTFDHAKTRFSLQGAHRKLDCARCHVSTKDRQRHYLIGLPEGCATCHATPHPANISRDCTACHTQNAWRPAASLKFNHQTQTRFALLGQHIKVACERCHKAPKVFGNTPTQCAGCHADPHAGQFKGQSCAKCHDESGFKRPNLRFNHTTMTSFTLIGKHQDVACEQCHAGMKQFRVSTTCAACHADPHQGQFGLPASCQACHQPTGWKGRDLLFRHDTMTHFPLTGRHQVAACAACHQDAQYRGTPVACAACHADPHQGQFGNPAACQHCHQPAGWKGKAILFKHDAMTGFPLTGRHTRLACGDCHRQGKFRDTPMDCADCHQNPHQGRLKDCATCHTTRGFGKSVLKFDHNRQTPFPLTGLHATRDCAKCHADLSFRVRGATCAACHDDVEGFYAGTLFSKITPGKPDPMHGPVKCVDCHQNTDIDSDPVLIRKRCIACHNPQYGIYFDESRQVIAGRLEQMPPAITKDLEKKKAAEVIGRLGSHNVVYAVKLLDALVAGQPEYGY